GLGVGLALTFDNFVFQASAPATTTPTVTTTAASSISTTTATLGGEVTDDGGDTVTERGIEYSTTEGFTEGTGTEVAADEAGTGEFTVSVTGLTAGTTYYYRAYATNGEGTSYGDEVSFTTSASAPSGGTQTINFDDDGGAIVSAGDTDYSGEYTSIEYSVDEKNLIAESSGTEGVAIEDLSLYEESVPEAAVAMKN